MNNTNVTNHYQEQGKQVLQQQHHHQQQPQEKKQYNEEFYQAIINNNIELVSTLIPFVDTNTLNDKKQPPLYHAIQTQQWKMAQLLIEHNAILIHSNWTNECKRVVSNILHYAIQDDTVDESFIDFLLLSETNQSTAIIHIEQQDQKDGYTPLLTAAKYGNIRILQHLIHKYNPNVHIKSSNGFNLFHFIILSSKDNKCTIELLDLIKSKGVNINQIDSGNNCFKRKATPLTLAIYDGSSFEIIQKLVELGADIITTNDCEYNPNGDNASSFYTQSHLFKAIQQNDDNYKLFNYLIESCPPSSNIPFKSILQQEFNNLNFESIQFIIETHRMKFDNDPLQINLFQSIFQGFYSTYRLFEFPQFPIIIQMVEYLLGQNVQNCFKFDDVKVLDSTPLLIFAQYSQSSLRLLQLMVQNGANAFAVDKFHEGVLQQLCRLESDTTAEDIISKLDYFISLGLDIHCNVDSKVETILHLVVQNNKFSSALVSHLIQHYDVNINTSDDSHNYVPLHHVLEPELVLLLSTPATINYQNIDGYTPLLLSLQSPDIFRSADIYYQVISNLIDYGADVKIADNSGNFPIHAVFQPNFRYQPMSVIKLLIQQPNINLNIINDLDKATPLQFTIKRFIDSAPSLISTSNEYNGIRLKAIKSMKLLLQYNADVTGVDFRNRTLLHYIVSNADFDIFDEIDIEEIDDDCIQDCFDTIIDGIIDQTIITSNLSTFNQP